ncbi:MAG: sulfatase family protein [Alphaproteobacteria bacterium]
MGATTTISRFRQLLDWCAVGVLGGGLLGVLEAIVYRREIKRVVFDETPLNFALHLLIGLTFYSQIFLAVMLAAGVFFLYLLPWPRSGRLREPRGNLGLAVATLLIAVGLMIAGIEVNKLLPGVTSPASMLANLGLLIGGFVLILALHRLLGPLLARAGGRRALWIPAVAFEAAALTLLLSLGIVREPDLTDKGRGEIAGPNVLLITVDTLRADHLSVFGYDRIRTPHFDRLAGQGALFTRHIAATSWTLPTLVSLHTGTYPDVHGVTGPEMALDAGFVTVAEAFQTRGYLTAAYLTNAYLESKFKLNQGFDAYVHARNHRYSPTFVGLRLYRFLWPMHGVRHAARRVTTRALDFLAQHRDSRFFMWIHYIDPHLPYGDWYIKQLPYARDLQAKRGAAVTTLDPYLRREKVPTDEALRHMKAAYDAEILYTDRQLGRLLDGLAEMGLAENTLVVLTGDHGEEFWDHEFLYHGYTLYRESVHVPLMVRWPGRIAAGGQIEAATGTVDIAPTLFEIAGIEPPPGYVGRSLWNLLQQRENPGGDRRVFSMLSKFGLALRAAHTDRFDLIEDGNTETLELYEFPTDPQQEHNVAEQHPSDVERLWADIRAWAAEAPQQRQAIHSGQDNRIELDEATRQHLRALGYLN